MKLFDSYIIPILDYGAEVWSQGKQIHDIEFVQNMISSSIWIGLTTNRADGWMWSDGTAVQVGRVDRMVR